ncbi:MAG: undecaprenyldiphospho-muramoylpentapeptide beta-N-acetylglucosaminyltransferase [Ignavibacteria bacterium]|nr:undecaprenyldiphospho-muramoylpentapeptide beta-N-acetylglucosaminyltransferase [Ignavibacteria bacterium]
MINRAIFAAGGTGGHIYPALAVADELKKINQDVYIKFIGAKGKIEEKIVPENKYELKLIELEGFQRRLNLKNLKNIYSLIRALNMCRKIIKEFNPDIVFATGGYVSWPVAKAACSFKIPYVMLEGNAYPGLAVRMLSKSADKVIVNFKQTVNFLKRRDNVVFLRYPFRSNLKVVSRKEALLHFGLDDTKKTLLVLGGSQGARSVNSAMIKHYKVITEKGIQIIWQTGNNEYDRVHSLVNQTDVKVLKYIDRMDYAYSAADLLLSRAGISTITEAAFFKIPMVAVPYPYSSDNHQRLNAEVLKEAGAAEIINDNELEVKIPEKIIELISNDLRLNEMRGKMSEFADSESAGKIAELLDEIVKRRN